jgi:hypothetical protein
MRWLVIGLLVSVGTLLLLAGGVARHVRRHKRSMAEDGAELEAQKLRNAELDKALDFHEAVEPAKNAADEPAK